MKIKGQQPDVQHATPQSMKKIVKEQELIFQKRLDDVDASKTKTQTDKWGNTTNTYYDKTGKVLYSRTEVSKDAWGGYIYGYHDDDGNSVRFLDHDKDGNMDEMSYVANKEAPKYTAFQAYDTNDDGVFDEGMPNTGAQAGKHFDIKN